MTVQDTPATSSPPPSQPQPRTKPAPHTHWVLLAVIVLLTGLLLWYAGVFRPRPDIAIVAGESPYWDLVIKGAQEAADKYDANLIVVRAKPDADSQSAV